MMVTTHSVLIILKSVLKIAMWSSYCVYKKSVCLRLIFMYLCVRGQVSVLEVMYLCVRGIDFAYFYFFDIWLHNCSAWECVIYCFSFHYITFTVEGRKPGLKWFEFRASENKNLESHKTKSLGNSSAHFVWINFNLLNSKFCCFC